jgi:signal transduction histidine kinase/ActR/RegA family two-component response regulator
VFATQLGEHLLIDRPYTDPERRIGKTAQIVITLISGFNASLYVGLAVPVWFCGAAGQMFSLMLIGGALLHVCLHLYSVPMVQFAGAVTPVALLFGLPLVSDWLAQGRLTSTSAVMVAGAAMYLAHLIAGVAENQKINRSLTAATAEAEAQTLRAEEESRAKSTFLATMSHEIRTPLHAITSAANLLKATPLQARQSEYVQILVNGSEVLAGLINQVLDMSKIEAGKMALDAEPFPLAETVEKVASLWRIPAWEKRLGFEVAIDPGLPPWLEGDAFRVSQILFNLLSNAVKFSETGAIRLEVLRYSRPGQDKVAFKVVDNGPGIAPDDQDRLFHSFEQADAGTTRRFGGTGLGLAISKSLAELMRGRLFVESRLGEGATFILEIPLIPVAPPGAPMLSPVPSGATLRPLKLLVAEDHAVNRRLLELILEPLGARLVVTVNGEEAVRAAMAEPFDAILMDHHMPVLSGLDAALAIRSHDGPNCTTPIFALTADAFDDRRRAWTDAGANGFLTKPIDAAQLMSLLSGLGAADAA